MSLKKVVHCHRERDALCVHFGPMSNTEELLENKRVEKMVAKQVW